MKNIKILLEREKITAPNNSIIVSCIVGYDDFQQENKEILELLKNDYEQIVENLNAYSMANDYTVQEIEEEEDDYKEKDYKDSINDMQGVGIFCYIDLTKDKELLLSDWILLHKPTMHLVKLF